MRRSLSLPYTEQEIQRWREERRRHYPSKSNIEKVCLTETCLLFLSKSNVDVLILKYHLQKLSEKLINSEVIEREAKMRREVYLLTLSLSSDCLNTIIIEQD